MTMSSAAPQGPREGDRLTSVPDALRFLHNESEMAAAIRAHDWASTPLGPPGVWPQPLRMVVRLMLNSRHPMYVFWGNEHICLYNDAYSACIGPERHPQSLGQPGDEVWSEIWDIIGPQIELVMSAGGGTWHENHLVPITRNGAREDVYWTYGYSPIDDEASPTGVGGVLVVCADTTKHVLAEQRLAEYAANQAADCDRIWRNSRDLLAVLSFDGTIRAVNPAIAPLLGYEPGEVIGKSFLDFIWPEDAALTQADLGAVAQNSKPAYSENRYRHKDGSLRWLSWHTTSEGESIYAYGRDVTRRKQAQIDLEVAQEALRHAQKMEAIGQLTGGIAHDFNNMLQSVMGGITFAERRIAAGRANEAQKFLDSAREGATRAGLLTQRLLGFGRRQPLDPKSVALDELIPRMAGLIAHTVGPAITVRTELPEHCWPVLCDPNQLENALLNLGINARDAMLPDGGTLTIRVAHKMLEAADVAGWEGAKPGDYVRITVSDTGAGMPPEVLARAFDPFFTTKPMGHGTGLGLSQIYGFVRQSGGVVRLESALGAGTSAHLDLPRCI